MLDIFGILLGYFGVRLKRLPCKLVFSLNKTPTNVVFILLFYLWILQVFLLFVLNLLIKNLVKATTLYALKAKYYCNICFLSWTKSSSFLISTFHS